MTGPVGDPPVRGRVDARGFVLDPGTLGPARARERALSAWTVGSRLVALPDGAWLLALPAPVSVRAEQAPGAVVTAGSRGSLVVWRGGRQHEVDPDRLPAVDTSDWVGLADLPVRLLRPVEAPAPAVAPLAAAPTPVVEIGPAIGLRAATTLPRGLRRRATDARPGLPYPAPSRLRLVAGVVAACVVGVLFIRWIAATSAPTAAGPAFPRWISLAVIAGVVLAHVRRSQGAGRGAGRAARPTAVTRAGRGRRSLLPQALAKPFAAATRSRHERYVLGLTRSFQQGDYDSALRRAIGLQGLTTSGRGGWTVRLPSPRLGALAPSSAAGGAGPSLVSHLNMSGYLRELYAQAAADLERRGRIEEAAFVRADLLHNVSDAVQLLERHDRRLLAAELADGRRLPPDVVVRLWWRAGRRDRALDVARLRGGLEEAARRLEDVDRDDALDLRARWITGLLDAGDVVAATQAAWPFPALRPMVVPHFAAAVAAGGPDGARILAYVVAGTDSGQALAAAEDLLGSPDPALRAARAAFVTTLGQVRLEPASDRRLCSASLRLLLTEPDLLSDLPKKDATLLGRQIADRADAVLAADAPASTYARTRSPSGPFLVTALGTGTGTPVEDAVAVPAGIVVALGAAGVRLLTTEGRVRARWDVVADRIVPADHGHAVLLLSHGDRTIDVHRLDLRTLQVRRWAWLPDVSVAETFDGALLPVLDPTGLAILDTTDAVAPGGSPRTVWREFEAGVEVLRLARTSTSMSALVRGPSIHVEGRPQVWTWSQPAMTLRDRSTLLPDDDVPGPLTGLALAAGGSLLTLHGEGRDAVARLRTRGGSGSAVTLPGEGVDAVLSSGPHLMLVRHDGGQLVGEVLAADGGGSVAVRVMFPGGAQLRLRHHGSVVTVNDGSGRVVAADVRGGSVVVNTSVRP